MNENKKPVKKILYVITKSNWGGAQRYVYDLAVNLPQEQSGHPEEQYESVVVFGGTGPLALKLAERGVRTVSIPNIGRDVSVFGDIFGFFKLLSLFKKEKPDVVHVNSSKVGGLGALAARLARVPRIVFTCHGWPFNENRNFLSLSVIKFLSWLTVMLAHATIAVSMRDFHDGKNMLWAKNKMILVHNGIKTPDFKERTESRAFIADMAKEKGVVIDENKNNDKSESGAIGENRGDRKKDFLIGAIGELHKNKAYEYALQAVYALKQKNIPVKFVILGGGEERKKLENKIRELALERNVALLGFVGNAPQYLKAFDAIVLSSIKEGLPYVVIEAGFAGLPIVATNVGGVGEIIDDMKSGILIQTRKPDDIASALELIYKNPDRALSFGVNLKEKVEREFSLEKMVRKTIKIYEK